MSYLFSFEKLEVWKLSRALVTEIYRLMKKSPSDERFELTSQLQRAVVSVASNIAEGSSRQTEKDQAFFSQLAYSSLMEVLSQIILVCDLKLITSTT